MMKILFGGVPFGCDNIGDDAILECVLDIFRRKLPNAEFTVCCEQRKILEERLQIKTLPLYGFPPIYDFAGFAEEVKKFDLFVWSGATGLSDYPESALALLDSAHAASVPTVIWNVGMDSTLNPAFYRLHGNRRRLLLGLSYLTFSQIDFVAIAERQLAAKTREHIRRTLAECSLVVVRDEPSARELAVCGVDSVMIGADSAIRLESLPLPPELEVALNRPGKRLIGVCISAQRRMREMHHFVDFLNRLTASGDQNIVFLPMNPVTDHALMSELQEQMENKESSYLVKDCTVPGVVQSIASRCDVIVSSRLHLLILAGNVHVRPVGISRGSKVGNFLAEYGIAPCGTVDSCDFAELSNQLSVNRAEFAGFGVKVHEQLECRLSAAEKNLSALLDTLQR